MLHIALWEPEIPPNTGNIARLCAATGAMLHLIGRLGFRLDERSLRRAGVDCWDDVSWLRHATLAEFQAWRLGQNHDPARCFAFSAHATEPYTTVHFQDNDVLLFGGESHGLPAETLARFDGRVFTIPMPAGKTRSLNLATAVGIVLYEALHQLHCW
jgi:tRNA (cytidine/uridine-2'-O-)-methyltransferase